MDPEVVTGVAELIVIKGNVSETKVRLMQNPIFTS